MSHEARFTLALPPSVNDAYADVIKRSAKGFYTRRCATAALTTFKAVASQQLREQHVPHAAWGTAGALGCEATFYMRSDRSDLDNRVKSLLDSLSVLGFDDKRFVELHWYKRIDKERPRVEVRLYTVTQVED